jgi:hypothetical protein
VLVVVAAAAAVVVVVVVVLVVVVVASPLPNKCTTASVSRNFKNSNSYLRLQFLPTYSILYMKSKYL